MNKQLYLFVTAILIRLNLLAQQAPPQGVNYQAMVYVPYGNQQVGVNSAGQIPANTQNVRVVFKIENGMNGSLVYEETQQTVTDQYGMLTAIIGTGTASPANPQAFNQINWGQIEPYLRVSINLINYNTTVESYQKLWTVPYAFYADQSNSSVYADSSGHADTSNYAGSAGNGITNVIDNGNGTLTFIYLNGSNITTGVLTGLTGPQGPAGQSAYDIWISQGNIGSLQDFMNSLMGAAGPQGVAGTNGTNGLSAYEIWLQQGNTGTQADFLNSITGPQGAQGPMGVTGAQGPAGVNGTNGIDGKNTLVKTTTEVAGANCATGGTKIEVGLDANGNGALDVSEVNATLTKYVCNGTDGSQNAWALLGNTGTNSANNFIGTTDSIDLVVKSKNIERMRVTSSGNIGIGTSNPIFTPQLPESKFHLFAHDNFNYAARIQNGGGSGAGLLIRASAGSSNPLLLNIQDNFQNNRFSVLGLGNVGIGTSNPLGKFHVNNDVSGTDSSFVVTTDGNVGIGTSSPAAKLEVIGLSKFGIGGQNNLSLSWDNGTLLNSLINLNSYGTGLIEAPKQSNLTVRIQGNHWDDGFFIITGPDNVLTNGGPDNIPFKVLRNGNVGVGKYKPSNVFHVNNDVSGADSSFVVTTEGNVGIGTSSPNGKFALLDNVGEIRRDIGGTTWISRNSGNVLFLTNSSNSTTNTSILTFQRGNGTGNDAAFLTSSDGLNSVNTLSFSIGGAIRQHWLANGNIGIGTLTPDQLLSVNGNASKAGGGSWATFSDRRVKQDINPFKDGLDVLMKLNPVTFKYNEKSGYKDLNKSFVGFIAQDVENVAPYMVNLYDDSEGPSGFKDKRQFDESALNKILVNAVKEQQTQIESLKKEMEEMKLMINVLKNNKK